MMQNLGKRAQDQNEIDDFNRRQLELKNRRKLNDKE